MAGIVTPYKYHMITEIINDEEIKKAIIIGKVVKVDHMNLVIYVDDGTDVLPVEVDTPKLPRVGTYVRVFVKVLRNGDVTGNSDVVQEIPKELVKRIIEIEEELSTEIENRVIVRI